MQDDKQCLELEGISVDHLAHTFEDEKSSLVKQLDKSRQLNKELRMSQSTKGYNLCITSYGLNHTISSNPPFFVLSGIILVMIGNWGCYE